MKLTDTQLVLLSKASQREDQALELLPNLKGGAGHKVAAKLLAERLVEEIRARGSLPIWRRDEDDRPLALRITKRGLAAIPVEQGADKPEQRESQTEEPAGIVATRPARKIRQVGRSKQSTGRSGKNNEGQSKQTQVIALLSRNEGATTKAIAKATGWQQHSVRGFLAGVVRKKLGLTLVSEVSTGERVYRIKAAGRSSRKAA